MSCNKYYRLCVYCGRSVHLNSKCECGKNPWGKNSEECGSYNFWMDRINILEKEIAEKTILKSC